MNNLDQKEDDLRKSEEEYKTTLNNLLIGVVVHAGDTSILFSNPKASEILGLTQDQMSGKRAIDPAWNFIHEDMQIMKVEDYPVSIVVSTQKPLYDYVLGINRPDRNYITWVAVNALPIFRNQTMLEKVIVNFEDITKYKQAEKALLQSEKDLKNSQRIAHLGSWRLDLMTNQVEWTEELYRMYGFDPTLPPPPYTEHMKLFTSESWARLSASLLKTRETGIPYELELETVRKDGSNGWMWVRGEATRDAEGNIVGLWGAAQDITEKKKNLREKELMETRLQHAQKLDAIGILAGGIAHDFNNILSIITGNISYLLSQTHQDDEQFEILSEVQAGAKQAQSLTQQLLTFAKGGEPIKKAINLNRIVKDAAKFVGRGSKSRCEFDLSEDLWPIDADEGQINQVIGNLVINADQAMPDGGIIKIRTENTEIEANAVPPLSPGRYVKIIVEDRGVGISGKHLSKIFDPYFSTKQKGSGLGLATTYSIIKKHGGHITVYSELDRGTVFCAYLPPSLGDLQKGGTNQEIVHQGHGRILIMDDQESILKMVGRMLNRMGYETEFALNGGDAVEKYREAFESKKAFDLVILDLTIPGGMGGAKTVIELLKIDPNVKAVVSSGYSNDPIMANYEDYGFCGVVPKPYTKSQLSEILSKIFGENG